ncbi:MAG: hypothetical protein RID91_01775 [Azospirillaceae bacterium]
MPTLFDRPLWRPLALLFAPLTGSRRRRAPRIDTLPEHIRRDIGLPPGSGSA